MPAEDLPVVLDRQCGVVLRDQLESNGVSRYRVEAQIDARRWQALGPLVVVTHNGPLTRPQQLWAAVLNSGPVAALCARTAAAEAGLAGWEAPKIEVIVPRGDKIPSLPGVPVRLHESRRFSADDIHPTRQPPQTRPERSVMDAASWTRNRRSACGLVAAAVQQGVCRPQQVLDELERAGAIRHRRVLQLVLLDIEGGAQSLSEIDFGRLCRRFGLPNPERQVVRVDPDGRRRYLDAVLRANGRRVVVEIDGALHLRALTYWDDMDRDNEGTIAGERRLRFPSVALRIEPERVAAQVARALGLPTPRLSEPQGAIAP